MVPLPAVSWPWVSAWGSLEPPRRDGENAQKTGKNGAKMGEIRPKTCKGVGITWAQASCTACLAADPCALAMSSSGCAAPGCCADTRSPCRLPRSFSPLACATRSHRRKGLFTQRRRACSRTAGGASGGLSCARAASASRGVSPPPKGSALAPVAGEPVSSCCNAAAPPPSAADRSSPALASSISTKEPRPPIVDQPC